jgi:ribonuclease HI
MRVASDGYVGPSGEAAWAWVCSCGAEGAGKLPDRTASHLAEWLAAQAALEHLAVHAPGHAALQVDSALVAKGLAARRPEMSGEAAEVRAECRRTLARLAEAGLQVQVERVDREANAQADALARATAKAPQGPSPGA